ncbi:EpsG family protein [Deefgea salmonis]|uniref:EpsG family protein n=1 Tax=Deefgea salmonis TaxID=2875502 RepID=A0ABS8BK71_9NEIS|nr:EpsG family protein [Deefgea salmonis]MCB5196115.1 EpsG family protein [Deefgea salmonis]
MHSLNIYFVIYLLSLISFFVVFFNKQLAFFCSLFVAGLSFLLAAFRAEKFPDYEEYVSIFNSVSNSAIFSDGFFQAHGELGFKIIIKLLSMFGSDPLLLMIMMSLLSFVILVFICKEHDLNFSVVWLVYYSNSFLLKDLAAIRNSVASLLVVYVLLNLWTRRALYAAMFSAFCFQYFSFLALGPAFFYRKKAFLLLIPILFFIYPLLNFNNLIYIFGSVGMLAQYNGSDFIDPSQYSSFAAVFRATFFLFSALFILREQKNVKINILLLSVFFSIVSYLVFSEIPVLSQRIGGYFISVDAFLASYFLSIRSRRVLGAFLVFFYSFVMFYFNVTTRDFLMVSYESIF